MSEEIQSKERIEDWVAKEGKARNGKNLRGGKKWLLWVIIALIVMAVIGLVLFLLLRKKPEKISYLEGLDVMCGPNGIVADGQGGFLVTDVYGKKIWQAKDDTAIVYAGASSVKDASGQPMGGYKDGAYEESLFQDPWAIAPFLGGFAVSDTENHTVRLLRDGYVETINGHSNTLEEGVMGVTFDQPTGLVADEQGRLYVADAGRGTIYVITDQGAVSVFKDGLNGPMGICWYNGALYVAETGEHRIIRIEGGALTVIAGNGEEGDDDGASGSATFSNPEGIAISKSGVIYVSDTVNASVRRIKNGKVETILRLDDDELTTFPISPVGICCEGDKLYVCDPFARRVYILKQ